MTNKQTRKCAKCPVLLSQTDKALCELCKHKSRIKSAARRVDRAKNNLCRRCGKSKIVDGTLCSSCHPIALAATRKVREKYIKAGLCEKCGVPAILNSTVCGLHHNNNKVRLQARREAGLCSCGRTPVVGYKYCEKCRKRHCRMGYNAKIRVITHYGGKCACCGEAELAFLSIDHTNGGGNKHRREIGWSRLYYWLIRNNYPDGFQVLCMNCNIAKSICGKCPHQGGRHPGAD